MDNEIRAKIIAKAWKDEAFKNKLLNSPKEVLKEYGIDTKDVKIEVMQESQNQFYFLLPLAPTTALTLSESELEKLAAACCLQTNSWGPVRDM